MLVLGGIVMAISAASGRARSAGILFFALLTVADLFRQILPSISSLGFISPSAMLRQTNSLLFGLRLPFEFSAWVGLVVLILMAGLCLAVLWYRVRPVEVVR